MKKFMWQLVPIIKRLIAMLMTWRHTSEQSEPIIPSDEIQESEAPESPLVRQSSPTFRRAALTDDGDIPSGPIWNFRYGLLDRLDQYFVLIRRIKRWDRSAYQYFSRVGFSMPFFYANGEHQDVRVAFAGIPRRTVGGVVVQGGKDKEGYTHPSFIYFHKMKRPMKVQAVGSADVYRLTCFYDDLDKFQAPLVCHLAVDSDARIELLKEELKITHRIHPSGRKRGHARSLPFNLVSSHWAVPEWIQWVVNDVNDKGANPKELTAEQWVTRMLVLTVVSHYYATQRIVIRVKHETCVAAFGIELPTAKRFFKDREKTTAIARDGKRKRIFHAVRAHDRRLPIGRVTDVKAHYRGIRTFDWNGYQIHIVFPDNTKVFDMNMGLKYPDDVSQEERNRYRGEKYVGTLVAKILDR